MAKDKDNNLTATQLDRMDLYEEASKDMVPWFGSNLPNMSNWTEKMMVDTVGRLKQVEKDATGIIKTLNTIIDSKLEGGPKDGDSVRGESYQLSLTEVTTTRLAADPARAVIRALCAKLQEASGQAVDAQAWIDMATVPGTAMHHNYKKI